LEKSSSLLTIVSTTNQLTQQEKQACVILSELFLGTELTQLGLNHLTPSLRPLEISVPTSKHILRYGLFPILSPNLLNIAGEWQGIDEDWVLLRVQARRSAGASEWMKSESSLWLGILLVAGFVRFGMTSRKI
jgi:hypothetical protein